MTRSTGVGSHPGSSQADLDEAVRVVWSEVSLPYVPEVPGRGAHASMVGRALAVVSDLAADLQPAGWRLVGVSGTSGVDQRRARSLLGQDLDTVEEHAQEHAGLLKVQLAAIVHGPAVTGSSPTTAPGATWPRRSPPGSRSTSPTCGGGCPT